MLCKERRWKRVTKTPPILHEVPQFILHCNAITLCFRPHLILDHLHISNPLLCWKNGVWKQQRSGRVCHQGFLHGPHVLRHRARNHRHQERKRQETRNTSDYNLQTFQNDLAMCDKN
jgi:hypothetical protein